MDEDDSGIYDLSGAIPQTEGSHPEGGGVGSASEAGGNKRDPLSSSPTIGGTIAGRTVNTGAPGDITNMGHEPEVGTPGEGEHHVGGPSTEGKGVTGVSGSSLASEDAESGESQKGGPPGAQT